MNICKNCIDPEHNVGGSPTFVAISWSSILKKIYILQVDNKGRNFLHVAVQNSDIESVLFLISVKANVNSRVQDAAKLTPLHLAVQAGSEIIVRNLVSIPLSRQY